MPNSLIYYCIKVSRDISVTGGEFYKAKNAKLLWDAYKESKE